LVVVVAVFFHSAVASADVFDDVLVQPPSLSAPERGAIAGTMARLSFGPKEVARGSVSWSSNLVFSGEGGGSLVDFGPRYSPENPLTEWGMGWETSLAIRRFRPTGEVSYDDGDQFTSPWGRLVQGADGFWYVAGLEPRVKFDFEPEEDLWRARLPDGTTFSFGQSVSGERGTYEWYVTRAVSPLRGETVLAYETNDSGRPFLTEVTYGSPFDPLAYKVELEYEQLPQSVVSYRGGIRLALDRRVFRVVQQVKLQEGMFATRYWYELAHEASPMGPAFYLTGMTRHYASGETEPTISYGYDLGQTHLAEALFEEISTPGIDEILREWRPWAFTPQWSAFTDIDADGRVDLEHSYSYELLRQSDIGWTAEQLGEPKGPIHRYCRNNASVFNYPRVLARMYGEAYEPHVVSARGYWGWQASDFAVCTREGELLHREDIGAEFYFDENNRLVDVNGDKKPDILSLFGYSYRVIENRSEEGSFEFVVHEPQILHELLYSTPDVFWAHDMNGDTLVDIVARYGSDARIFYGKGDFTFGIDDEMEGPLDLRAPDGSPFLGRLQYYGFAFVDANNDGLSDLILDNDSSLYLFMNHGRQFVRQPLPAVDNAGWSFGNPVIADLGGTGNDQVVISQDSKLYALNLNRPETGLMTWADDGKGTHIEFGYARQKAEAGVRQRRSLLESVVVESSGHGTVGYWYAYDGPVIQSEGQYLVGFETVRRSTPWTTEAVGLYHDDELSGILRWTSSWERDSTGGTSLETSYWPEVVAPGGWPVAPAGKDAPNSAVDSGSASANQIVHFSRMAHDEVFHQGVRHWRLVGRTEGMETGDQATSLSTSTVYRYTDEEHPLCATEEEETNAWGSLVAETQIADVRGLAQTLHCLPGAKTMRGQHADSSLDFVHGVDIARNDLGQVTGVTAMADRSDGSPPMTLQEVVYHPELHRIESVSKPGQGKTIFGYSPTTGLLEYLERPDGVTVSVCGMDELTRAVTELWTDRRGKNQGDDGTGSEESASEPEPSSSSGEVARNLHDGRDGDETESREHLPSSEGVPVTGSLVEWTREALPEFLLGRSSPNTPERRCVPGEAAQGLHRASFRYDGMERLVRAWDNTDGSSEEAPLSQISYQFATRVSPGQIVEQKLVDAALGAIRTEASLLTAAGEPVGTAVRQPGGWAIGQLEKRRLGDLEQWAMFRSPIPERARASLTYDALFSDATTVLGLERQSGLGHHSYDWTVVQSPVDESIEAGPVTSQSVGHRTIQEGSLISETLQNGEYRRRNASDAKGTVTWKEDESGAKTHFSYDAAGRLVGVLLADGATQNLRFDVYGRPLHIERSDVGSVSYQYDPVTGLPSGKEYASVDGEVVRTVTWTRDAIGRLDKETHQHGLTGETQVFSFFYDGRVSEEEHVQGQAGHLSRIKGEGFERRSVYDNRERLIYQAIDLANWRTVEKETTYYDSDEVRVDRVTVRDAGGSLVEQIEQEHLYDQWGRLAELQLNGQPAVVLHYDDEGKLDRADVVGGYTMAFDYDGLTRRPNGYWEDAVDWNAGIDWTLNRRAFVANELLSFNEDQWDRTYFYDPRGYLSSAVDEQQTSGYTYGASGLPEWASDLASDRTLTWTEGRLEAGHVVYERDDFRRIVRREDLDLTYGPMGQIAVADRGDERWAFTYDEGGHRLIKFHNGVPVAAYVAGGYLDETGFLLPLRLAGRVVAVVRQGTLELVATDPRGTLLGERGVANLPTPYGVRERHPEMAAALDYAELGYDEDLGTVRMGVRDYYPDLNQFGTPDLVFLESLDRCAGSVVECSLFSYAGNNPVMNTDPNGEELVAALAGVAGGALIGGGIEAGRQLLAGEQFNLRRVGAAAAGGAVTGGLIGLTNGASLAVEGMVAVSATANVIGGTVTREINGEKTTLDDVAVDASVGMMFGMMGAYAKSIRPRTAPPLSSTVVAPRGGPLLPRSVGAAANITTRSRIGESPFAIRQARALGEAAQRDVDNLLAAFRAGNSNPGIGTRPLGGGFYELRGRNAGRVIIREISSGTYDIVGKFQGHVRGDTANSAVIQRLMRDYNAL
jgi:RHS repeat-associated protein